MDDLDQELPLDDDDGEVISQAEAEELEAEEEVSSIIDTMGEMMKDPDADDWDAPEL